MIPLIVPPPLVISLLLTNLIHARRLVNCKESYVRALFLFRLPSSSHFSSQISYMLVVSKTAKNLTFEIASHSYVETVKELICVLRRSSGDRL